MKILVVSDTHSRNQEFIDKVINGERYDMLFHLGDYVEDGQEIARALGVPSYLVRGNGDYDSNYKLEEVLDIEGNRIFLTHGHLYRIRFDLSNLYYRAREVAADLVVFGHTHVPLNIEKNGLKIFNPGSPSFPRQLKGGKTYGVIDIGDKIESFIREL